jgi:hypothetical protein
MQRRKASRQGGTHAHRRHVHARPHPSAAPAAVAIADRRPGRVGTRGVLLVRPGRMLFGGLAVLYLLAYLRGTALLVAVTATVGLLVWRSVGTRGRGTGGGAGRAPRWGVQDGQVLTRPLAAEVWDAGGWRMAPTVVHGVPEPAAGQPVGFAALVTLVDRSGRRAMLQIEAAHPAEIDLEGLVRQALGQAARRGGWQMERWQPVSDAAVTPAGWGQVEEWGR